MDFLVILPAEIKEASEIAQRYKISVVLDQDFNTLDLPFFYRSPVDNKNIGVTIEYADFSVFQHLKACVDGWVLTLNKRQPSGIVLSINKIERNIRPVLKGAIISFALLGGYAALKKIPDSKPVEATEVLLIALLFAFAGGEIIEYLWDVGGQYMRKLNPITYLKFTNGDLDRQTKTEKGLSTNRNIIYIIAVCMVITFTVNIFSSYFFQWLTTPTK